VEPILNIIEQNPTIDFGSPGPFVHFIEKFYGNGYEEMLIQSIERFPTFHTVWMLNRLINGSSEQQKKYFLNALRSILNSPKASKELKNITKEFLLQHN
jgi:hypothetical protein